MTSQKGLRACFSVVTVNAAKVMHFEGYWLETGCEASFVLLQARDAVEAIGSGEPVESLEGGGVGG